MNVSEPIAPSDEEMSVESHQEQTSQFGSDDPINYEVAEISKTPICDDIDEATYGKEWCLVGGTRVHMMIDSGSCINAISEKTWHLLKQSKSRMKILNTRTGRRLYAYASLIPLEIVARFRTSIAAENRTYLEVDTEIYVIKGARRDLLGKMTAREMNLLAMGTKEVSEWTRSGFLYGISQQTTTQIFPRAPVEQIRFQINPDVQPSQQYYIRIPEALRQPAMDRLLKMERQGIIEKVEGSPPWLSGLNVVMKGPNDFRLTLNMKRPNKAIMRPFYRIPTLEDIRKRVDGARMFSKLDLSQAFYHLELHESARELTNFMTMNGIYRYVRLLFGANSAPEIFQKFMDQVLAGVEGVVVFLDDMLCFAVTQEELEQVVDVVKTRLQEYNLTLNTDKCEYNKATIQFLGHRFDENGINIEELKVNTLLNFRAPRSASEARSFMGLANYVQHFIPNFGDLSDGVRESYATKGQFIWEERQENAFKQLKAKIADCTSTTLGAFRDGEETYLYTDASGVALGAVLTQKQPNGSWRTISFASKMLSPSERRYDQTSREAYAMVWAVERYQHYLIGREFTLMTDSSGAIQLMTREMTERSKRVLHRTENWRYRMEVFAVTYKLIKSRENIADCGSRMVGPGADEEMESDLRYEEYEISAITDPVYTQNFAENFLTPEEVRLETRKDEEFQKLRTAIETQVWEPSQIRYETFRDELHVTNGLLARKDKIILPKSLRRKAMMLAHGGHPGMSVTKRILRERVWWPLMDKDVDLFIANCRACQLIVVKNNNVPMARSIMPELPWDVTAIDHYGPMVDKGSKHILALVDYHSRYMAAQIVDSTAFEETRKFLENLRRLYGAQKALRSDNAQGFNKQLKEYCWQRGIQYQKSTAYFPQQNGCIESVNKLFKKAVSASNIEETNYVLELQKAVAAHNSAPHPVTGKPPEEAFLRRIVRRSLPSIRDEQTTKLVEESRDLDAMSKERTRRYANEKRVQKPDVFLPGDVVVCKRKAKKFKHDSYYEPALYKVKRVNPHNVTLVKEDGTEFDIAQAHLKHVVVTDDAEPNPDEPDEDPENDKALAEEASMSQPEEGAAAVPLRRSVRVRKAPESLDAYVRCISDADGSLSNILAVIEADLSTREERYGCEQEDQDN